jgi:hypothetical protein
MALAYLLSAEAISFKPEGQTLCGSRQLFTLPMATSIAPEEAVLFQRGQQNKFGNTNPTAMNAVANQKKTD